MSTSPSFIPLSYDRPGVGDIQTRSRGHYEFMDRRRTVRDFSRDPIPVEVVKDLVRTASTAPSGAHKQPWTFVAVSDPTVKRDIRLAAEAEERENYAGRMPPDWLEAIAPLGTDEHKPFLEDAPWLVVLFRQDYGLAPDGARIRHYYAVESVGIAAGFFLTAVHRAGLVALTHTPSPMGFLKRILGRPDNETVTLIMPLGYPARDATVPDLVRKPLDQVLVIK